MEARTKIQWIQMVFPFYMPLGLAKNETIEEI